MALELKSQLNIYLMQAAKIPRFIYPTYAALHLSWVISSTNNYWLIKLAVDATDA
jgi:hypothetical protein